MIEQIPISSIKDFPCICEIYKESFINIKTHMLAGARIIDKNRIEGLGRSIMQEGLYNPVLVRHSGDGYEMVDGHIRKYSFKGIKKKKIPAKIIKVDDIKAKVMLITANRMQKPLDPIEESWVIKDLIDKHGKSIRESAVALGLGRSWVYNRYKLATQLVSSVQVDIAMGLISARTAIEITSVHARGQLQLAEVIKRHGLSYRQSHELIRVFKDKNISERIKGLALDDPRAVIDKLSENKMIRHKKRNELSYFAGNFAQEVDKLTGTALDVEHRINRDYAAFNVKEREVLSGKLNRAYRRISRLKKLMEGIDYGKESDIRGS